MRFKEGNLSEDQDPISLINIKIGEESINPNIVW